MSSCEPLGRVTEAPKLLAALRQRRRETDRLTGRRAEGVREGQDKEEEGCIGERRASEWGSEEKEEEEEHNGSNYIAHSRLL